MEREKLCVLDDVVESMHQPSWRSFLSLDGLSQGIHVSFYDHWVRILLMTVESTLN